MCLLNAISFTVTAILVYRALRTIRKKTLKLIHTAIHVVVIVLIIIAFIAALDSHNLAATPIPNFYTLHSWLGLITIGLYLLQVIIVLFLNISFIMSEVPP